MLVRRSLYPALQIKHEQRRMRHIDLALSWFTVNWNQVGLA
jgi:hypothetical protein